MFPDRFGQLVLVGYGCRLAVDKGHLVAADGIADDRRAGVIGRAEGLRRLVLLGHGTVSLDAFTWCADTGVAVVIIDRDGRLVTVAGPEGRNEPALRRAQVLAGGTALGVAVTCDLLRGKLAGQARVVAELPGGADAASLIGDLAAALRAVPDTDTARLVEAQAAAAYWAVVARVPVRWATRDRARVPPAWQVVGVRRSPLSGSPRRAVAPFGAMLNYLMACVEAEARIACLVAGLDPGLGLLHADLTARDSMALDLLEPVRPEVESWLLGVLRERVFGFREFGERPDGVVRVAAPLAAALASTGPRWRTALAPWTERVARALLTGQPTPLTQDHRSAGRAAQRRRPRRTSSPGQLALPAGCETCGVPVTSGRRRCAACLANERTERLTTGLATIRRARAAGHDPAHGGDAARRRGQTNAEHGRQRAAWDGPAGDPERFRSDVLSRIADVPVAELARRTGLSLTYVSLIRRGERVPHPRYWAALAEAPGARPAERRTTPPGRPVRR
jgi:CRISPR-associated endonuclease Cas1